MSERYAGLIFAVRASSRSDMPRAKRIFLSDSPKVMYHFQGVSNASSDFGAVCIRISDTPGWELTQLRQ
jgi:hypothetical protein